MPFLKKLLVAAALPAFLAGCAVGPDYEKPVVATPATWTDPADAGRESEDAALESWWRGLGDERLTSLIDRSLASNLDLAVATARLRQARGRTDVADAALIPNVSANAGHTLTHNPENRDHLSSASGTWRSGLDAAWELDIFGANRRNIEAAEANAQAALESRRAVRISVAGEVALNYAKWITATKQKRFALSNVDSSAALLKLVKLRREAGAASELDLVNARTDLVTARSSIPAFESTEAEALNALAVLLAVEPRVIHDELSGLMPDISLVLPAVSPGIPSDLLRRRPDIRQAERSLQAANAGIGAAIADYFPKFSLTGNLGVSANVNASSPGLAWSAGPNISWNPFQGGAVSANVEINKALRDESTLTYRKTVISAVAEVESALVANRKDSERRILLREVLEGQRKSVELTTSLYEQGQTDLDTLIIARRQLYTAQSALAGGDNASFTSLVTLYKALGGGWSEKAEREADEKAASETPAKAS